MSDQLSVINFIPRRCTSVYNGGSKWGKKNFELSSVKKYYTNSKNKKLLYRANGI